MTHGSAGNSGLRLAVAAAAASLAFGAASSAWATSDLVIYGYPGNIEEVFRASIIPDFEAKYDVRITYAGSASSDTLAKLLAQQASPQADVVIMDDSIQMQARNFDLLAPLDTAVVTALEELYPVARLPDDVGAIYTAIPTGIAYNTQIFAEQGLTPPESWHDLWRPEFDGRLIMHSVANTLGFYELIMAARINGGSEQNIEPGFAALSELAPRAITFNRSADVSSFFQQGDAWIGVWNITRTNILANSGFPIKFVYPVEGTPGTLATVSVVKGAHNPEAAQLFANYLLSVGPQKIVATEMGSGPVNRNVQLTEEEAALVPYGENEMGRIVRVDWEFVNQHRAEWIDRWNKEIESQ